VVSGDAAFARPGGMTIPPRQSGFLGHARTVLVAALLLALTLEASAQLFVRLTKGYWWWDVTSYAASPAYASPAFRDHRRARHVFHNEALVRFEPLPQVTFGAQPDQHFDTLNVNRLGFRGSEISSPRGADTYRIVVLGGSTVWGNGASDDSLTLPGQLADYLQRHRSIQATYSRYEVINAGQQSYSTAEELDVLVHRVLNLQPNLVIVYDGWNDVLSAAASGDAGVTTNWTIGRAALQLETMESPVPIWQLAAGRTIQYFERRSVVVSAVNGIAIRVVGSSPFVSEAGVAGQRPVAASAIAANYARNIQAMRAVCTANHTAFVHVLQPYPGSGHNGPSGSDEFLPLSKASKGAFAQLLGATYDADKQLLARVSPAHEELDLTGIFDDRSDMVFWDFVHVTDDGNAVLAQSIGEYLLANRIVE